jgi:hypothetical protein
MVFVCLLLCAPPHVGGALLLWCQALAVALGPGRVREVPGTGEGAGGGSPDRARAAMEGRPAIKSPGFEAAPDESGLGSGRERPTLRGTGVGNECVDPGAGFCYTGSVAKRGVAGEPPDRQIRWERLGGVRRSCIEPADRRGLVVRGLWLSAVKGPEPDGAAGGLFAALTRRRT